MTKLNQNISMYDEVLITEFLQPEHYESVKNTYKIQHNLFEKKDKNSPTIFKNCWIDFPHELIDIDSKEYTMSMKCLFIPLMISTFSTDTKNSLIKMFINRNIDLLNKDNKYEFNNPNTYLIDELDDYDFESNLKGNNPMYIYLVVDDRNPRFKDELTLLKKEPLLVDYYNTGNWNNHQVVLKFIYPFKMQIEQFLNNELDKLWNNIEKYQILTANPVILNTYFRYDNTINNYYIRELTKYLVGINYVGDNLNNKMIMRKVNKEVNEKIREFNIDDQKTIDTLIKQAKSKYQTEEQEDEYSIKLENETLK